MDETLKVTEIHGKRYGYSVRRQALRLFSDGYSVRYISSGLTIDQDTVYQWARKTGIKRGSKLSDEVLDTLIAPWKIRFRDSDDLREIEMKPMVQLVQAETKKVNAEMETFVKKIRRRIEERIEINDTVESLFKKGTAVPFLQKWEETVLNLPPADSWKDIRTMLDILMETLGINENKEPAKNGVDLSILNLRVKKTARKNGSAGRELEAELVNTSGDSKAKDQEEGDSFKLS